MGCGLTVALVGDSAQATRKAAEGDVEREPQVAGRRSQRRLSVIKMRPYALTL